MRLKALRPHRYNGEDVKEGQGYEALSEIHAQLLVAFGHAKLLEETPRKAKKKGRPRKKQEKTEQ